MKNIWIGIFLSHFICLTFTGSPTFANSELTGIYCFNEYENAQFEMATKSNSYCKTALKTGVACFTGHPHVVVDLINKQKYFRWEEETIRASHYQNESDTIEYLFINYSNGNKQKFVLYRCQSLDN